MTEPTEQKPQQKAIYNPQSNYQWQPEDIFPLKGIELHLLKKILDSLIASPEAQRAIAAYEGLKLVDGLIKEGVETGKIIEVPQEEEKSTAIRY